VEITSWDVVSGMAALCITILIAFHWELDSLRERRDQKLLNRKQYLRRKHALIGIALFTMTVSMGGAMLITVLLDLK
jgi:hypothetical protein